MSVRWKRTLSPPLPARISTTFVGHGRSLKLSILLCQRQHTPFACPIFLQDVLAAVVRYNPEALNRLDAAIGGTAEWAAFEGPLEWGCGQCSGCAYTHFSVRAR